MHLNFLVTLYLLAIKHIINNESYNKFQYLHSAKLKNIIDNL